MIKALAGDTLILAITEENVALMRTGHPVLVDLATMGNPKFTKIAIDVSATMAEAVKKFSPYVGPDTRIHGKES